MTSQSQRILFVFSSISQSLRGDATGWRLPEVAHPYYELSKNFTIDFAAPTGLSPPMDPASKEQYQDDEDCKRFLKESESLLKNTMRLSEVDPDHYRSIFYVGGRGSVIDLPEKDSNIEVEQNFIHSGKLVCAVGHGTAALVYAARPDGVSIFNGKEATGSSDDEEHQIGRPEAIPFLIQRRITLLGGTYVKAEKPWEPKVVCCGNLLTGQNPASARPLAQKMKEILQKSSA